MIVLLASLVLPGGCDKGPERPHVVVVVLDTMRRDVAGLHNGATPEALKADGLTPNLDALGERGVTFTKAFSAAPWTVPSHASMMTGELPSGHFCISKRPRLAADVPTFAEKLRDAGYATGAFFSNPWLTSKATDVLRGFEVQDKADITGLFSLESRVGDQGGRETVGAVTNWLRERAESPDEPFLLFVNLLEAHLSYDPPDAYRRQRLSDLPAGDTVPIAWAHEYNAALHPHDEVDWSRVTRLYAGDAWFADMLLGRLLAHLEETGLADDAIVIVTSDHGENLGDHGLMEHQFSVHETLLAVPLVIHVPEKWRDVCDPGAGPGGRRDDPVQTTDLYATALDAAGLDISDPPPFSRTWFGPRFPAERPIFAEYAGPAPGLLEMLAGRNPGFDPSHLDRALGTVRVGDLRLTADDLGLMELHDMARDPGQLEDIAYDNQDAANAMLQLLMQAVRGGPDDRDPVEIDPETRRQLESLGYIH